MKPDQLCWHCRYVCWGVGGMACSCHGPGTQTQQLVAYSVMYDTSVTLTVVSRMLCMHDWLSCSSICRSHITKAPSPDLTLRSCHVMCGATKLHIPQYCPQLLQTAKQDAVMHDRQHLVTLHMGTARPYLHSGASTTMYAFLA